MSVAYVACVGHQASVCVERRRRSLYYRASATRANLHRDVTDNTHTRTHSLARLSRCDLLRLWRSNGNRLTNEQTPPRHDTAWKTFLYNTSCTYYTRLHILCTSVCSNTCYVTMHLLGSGLVTIITHFGVIFTRGQCLFNLYTNKSGLVLPRLPPLTQASSSFPWQPNPSFLSPTMNVSNATHNWWVRVTIPTRVDNTIVSGLKRNGTDCIIVWGNVL